MDETLMQHAATITAALMPQPFIQAQNFANQPALAAATFILVYFNLQHEIENYKHAIKRKDTTDYLIELERQILAGEISEIESS